MKNLEKLLLNPLVYARKTKKVRMIKTSVNFVFLTDKYVYKIKQPIKMFGGKIDYTTLAKRRKATYDEYKINKLFSPEIYNGVVPITLDEKTKIKVNSKGKIIDYAIEMKRLPQDKELFQLIKKNKITEKEVKLLATNLKSIHKKLSQGRKYHKYGSVNFIKQRWQEIFDWMNEKYMKKVIPGFIKSKLSKWFRKNFSSFAIHIQKRRVHAQRIHGDLNTENIFYVNGKFYFIDVNELLDEWKHGDPLNDIGAIIKDLDAHKRYDLAAKFISAYFNSINKEIENSALIYKLYWATIRYLVYADLLAKKSKKNWGKDEISKLKTYQSTIEYYLNMEVI